MNGGDPLYLKIGVVRGVRKIEKKNVVVGVVWGCVVVWCGVVLVCREEIKQREMNKQKGKKKKKNEKTKIIFRRKKKKVFSKSVFSPSFFLLPPFGFDVFMIFIIIMIFCYNLSRTHARSFEKKYMVIQPPLTINNNIIII